MYIYICHSKLRIILDLCVLRWNIIHTQLSNFPRFIKIYIKILWLTGSLHKDFLNFCCSYMELYYFYSSIISILTLFRMVLFWVAHGWREGSKKTPFPKMCHTYISIIIIGTVMPYLKKIRKVFNHVKESLSSADISIFWPEIGKFCYTKKKRYWLHFDK